MSPAGRARRPKSAGILSLGVLSLIVGAVGVLGSLAGIVELAERALRLIRKPPPAAPPAV